MKKLITLLLLFTLIGFLSGNQVVITNDYEYIVSEGKTYNFSNGNESNNVKYDRTNKIAIQNNKVLADILKYHYAFFWDEADSFIGYYKTNKGITTSGAYLGQVNTQSIPLPLNAYSFALVRYDNDYVLVNGYTIEDLFIDNNLADVDPDDFNDIPIAELNGLTLNEVFDDGNIILNGNFDNDISNWNSLNSTSIWENGRLKNTGNGTSIVPRASQNITINLNDQYYHRFDYEIFSTVINVASIAGPSGQTFIATGLVFKDSASVKITANSNNTSIAISHRYSTNADSLDKVLYLDNIYMLNLTALGLTSLTKSQLDTYFSIYQNGVNATYYATDGNVSSVDGYYYAAGKNLFDRQFTTETVGLTYEFINNSSFKIRGTSTVGRGTINLFPNIIYLSNTQYTFSGTSTEQNAPTNARLDIYYTDGTSDFIFVPTTTPTPFTKTSAVSKTLSFISYTYGTAGEFTLIENFQIEEGTAATSYQEHATPTTTLNLTFLFGIGNEPDKATMDGYYAEYEEYLEYLYVCCNIFATQTISFETIYFDDGVSTEIERLGSILIFTLIGFTLMIFGFASKRRIFNLLAVGAFVVLGFLLIEFVGFIIILFGLIFVNVYYTFFGEL